MGNYFSHEAKSAFNVEMVMTNAEPPKLPKWSAEILGTNVLDGRVGWWYRFW